MTEHLPVSNYGIIYNWDGAPHGYSEYPQSLEAFLEKVYAPLSDTQVGAMCWSMGTHEAPWSSKVVETVGDGSGRKYDSVRQMHYNENIREFLDQGVDFYGAMVERGHQHGLAVLASIRMNDNHFWDLVPDDLREADRADLTSLRRDHPEWLLGVEQAPRWASTSWNMAIPQVRNYLLAKIGEVLRLADWDGVELDWQRHAFHLPEDDAYRLRYTLTDLQRGVWELAQDIGRQRGRPFRVVVRVATTLASCRRIGYDMEAWVDEGLCDIVVGGGNSGTDPGMEIEAFKLLCRPRGILVYGGLDTVGRQQAKRLVPAEYWREAWLRAVALGYRCRGADGIYVFNWHGVSKTHRPLLSTLGAKSTLIGKDKIYAALHRHIAPRVDGGRMDAERDDRIYGETPVLLLETLTGTGPVFHVDIFDDVVEASVVGGLRQVELHIEISHWAPEDRVRVSLDGTDLGEPEVANLSAVQSDDPNDVDESSWLVWRLEALQVDRGEHEILVVLLARDCRMRAPLEVCHVEFHIRYAEQFDSSEAVLSS